MRDRGELADNTGSARGEVAAHRIGHPDLDAQLQSVVAIWHLQRRQMTFL